MTQDLARFIDSKIRENDLLYILGDLFNVWLGDDDLSPFNIHIIELLRDCPGTVFIMHGNRDFLLGEEFCRLANCELVSDPSLIDISGEKVLLMHGDSLCTEDVDYLKAKTQLRDPAFQADFLSKSIEERQVFADQARVQSKAHTRDTSENIMDVTPSEVIKIMEEYGVSTLIHGHTHRPAIHPLEIKGKESERIVLGDWGGGTWYGQADKAGIKLHEFP